MVITYFGADRILTPEDDAFSLNRRNMAILYSLTQSKDVTCVINCIRTTRKRAITESFKRQNEKHLNFYFAPILPERGILKTITKPVNRFLLKCLNFRIYNILKHSKVVHWCYWPKGFLDWEYLNLKGKLVFDTDHNIINDPNLLESQIKEREKLLLRAGKKALLIISSARSMLEWYQQKGYSNTLLVLNGVFEERINLKPALVQKTSYTITYCGTLSKWIKIDWLIALIKRHPQWEFNIIGENYKTELSKKFACFDNVILHGFLKPSKVNMILKRTDVAIGLYNENPALDVNSMKLYDYLSQGISVVVNNYHDYLKEDFNGLINIADTYVDFERLIYNVKAQDQILLQEFLCQSLWQNRVQKR